MPSGKGGKGGKGGKVGAGKSKKAPQSRSMRAGLQVFPLFIGPILIKRAVPSWKDPQIPEGQSVFQAQSGSHLRCLWSSYSRVPHSWSAWTGWKCYQGTQCEENHPKTPATGHQRRWGTGHFDQGHNRWRRSHSQSPPGNSHKADFQKAWSPRRIIKKKIQGLNFCWISSKIPLSPFFFQSNEWFWFYDFFV